MFLGTARTTTWLTPHGAMSRLAAKLAAFMSLNEFAKMLSNNRQHRRTLLRLQR